MNRKLSIGMAGPDVSELQSALNFHIRKPAVPLDPDGKFGPKTHARVREFQGRAKIGVDGIVGPETISALYRTVAGVVEANLVPNRSARFQASPFQPTAVSAGQRSALLPGIPRLGQVGPVIPDFVPPSLRVPQIGAASSRGYELESKVFINPLADKDDGEHPLRLTLTIKMPWPVFLPEPLDLDVETTSPGVGKFQLDGKIKFPFKLVNSGRVELKPYFFVGAGVKQENFKELNAGAGGRLRLKLFENIGGTGLGLGLEADGGGKYNWDKAKGEAGVKGFFEGGFVLEGRF